jgi:NAD(P)-dependent dehydrogenase (short-subunit alcohol dehydrogenase family)
MVTGANTGIGKETALALARYGATVVMVVRNQDRGAAAREEIVAATGNERVELLLADLSSQASIRELAGEFRTRYERLNVLVNNAGVFLTQRLESIDGLEMTFATNHLGYFMLTLLLWDPLIAAAPSRVVNVSSDAHRNAKLDFNDLQNRKNYQGFRAYSQSKLANVLFTYELDRRRQGADVTVNALHPGFVASNFGRNNPGLVGWAMRRIVPFFARSVSAGAATSIYLAYSPEVVGASGKYFVDSAVTQSSPLSYNRETAARLWEASEELTGVQASPSLARRGQ